MIIETEEFANTLRWQHSMGQAGIERLLERFKVSWLKRYPFIPLFSPLSNYL